MHRLSHCTRFAVRAAALTSAVLCTTGLLVAARLAGASESCLLEWTPPFQYVSESMQDRCEATRCELSSAGQITAVAVVFRNINSTPEGKLVRVFLQEDAGGTPGATLWSLDATPVLEAGETRTVIFTVSPPVFVPGPGPIWLGHQEYTPGFPTSLYDPGAANGIHATSSAPCGTWTEWSLGDFLQYLFVEAPAAVPDPADAAPTSVIQLRSLDQPTGGTIRLELELSKPQEVTVELFSLSGRKVGTPLAAEPLAAGVTVRNIDTAGFPSGIYLLRLEAPGVHITRKVLLFH